MFNIKNISEYQLEITTFCNASCPQCPRNINGGVNNPYLKLEHLSENVIDKTFSKDLCNSTERIFFCGSYGDPIMHPKFLKILATFRKKNPSLWLFVHTNGSAHDSEYWEDMASIIGDYGHVEFNIDGLEDTNHIYRINTDFNKIIINASAFINAGGKAKWNFIVFKHNEHQVNDARIFAKEMGFVEFSTRATGRFMHHDTLEEVDDWPIMDKNNNIIGKLEIPLITKFKNRSTQILPEIKKTNNNYFNTTTITCDSLNKNTANKRYNKPHEVKIVINAHGWAMPCNFFNHNLHDARFRDKHILPGSHNLSFLPNGVNQIVDLFDRHNAEENLNINNKSLNDIFECEFWDEIEESFDKSLDNGRFFECAMTCGNKLNKVWDQTMKKTFLVTGGNRGLGLEIINYYGGVSISRSSTNENNHIIGDITNETDINKIAIESLKYDVFVNSAFDGPPGEPWANFAQVNLLIKIYETWKENNKSGHIINIGSVGEKNIVAPNPDFERYRISKSALAHASKQCSMAFKNNLVPFKTSLLTPDRIDTPMVRDRDSWTGNGIKCDDLIKTIDYIFDMSPNTCIEEVVLWVNFDFNV